MPVERAMRCSANKPKIIPIALLEEISSQMSSARQGRTACASLLAGMW
jgi:hypothetical protein